MPRRILAVVQQVVPIGQQRWTIMPTALMQAALSNTGYVAIAAGLERDAWLRRGAAALFIGYAVALAAAPVCA